MLSICFSAFVQAQSQQWRNYSAKDGLPSSVVYDMLQDSSGYIWFAGDMGVSRFDGYSFTNFSTQNGLPNNSITRLAQDRKQRIWFISFSGEISYYHKGKIYALPCNKALAESQVRSDHISSFYVDENDTLWIGTEYNGIMRVSPGWKEDDMYKLPLPNDGLYICNIDNTGYLSGWLGRTPTNEFVLSVYDKNHLEYTCNLTFSSEQFPFLHEKPTRCQVTRLKDGLMLASVNNHVWHIRNKEIQHEHNEPNLVFSCNALNGEIWYGTYAGVNIRALQHSDVSRSLEMLENKSITHIQKDHENGIWVSTDGLGVYYMPFSNFSYFTRADGLTDSKITIATADNGALLLGHLNGTITQVKNNRLVSLVVDPAVTGIMNSVSTLLPRKNGDVLIGTYAAIYSLNTESTVIKTWLPKFPVKKLLGASNGNLWTVQYSEIKQLDEKFQEAVQLVINSYTDNLFEDSKGVLWICSMNGLWSYSNGSMEQCGTDFAPLFSRAVDVKEDSDGNIWIATRGNGVVVKKQNKYIHITQKHGLSSDMCASLHIDSLNFVWVATNRGLSRIQLANDNTFKISCYTAGNGLLSNEINNVVQLNGKLWLIHNNEISVVSPNEITANSTPPPVFITQVTSNGKNALNNQHFSYNENYIEINYVGLSFKTAGTLQYKYKLEGLDKEWNHTRYTSVKYQTLPAGNYKFMVYAQNNDGVWSKKPATFVFTVALAWWKTWWFILFTAVVILGIIILVFRLRLRQLLRLHHGKQV